MGSVAEPKTLCGVDALVVSCTATCREHVTVELAVPRFPPSEPGQFLLLECRTRDNTEPAVHDWPPSGFPSLSDKDLREPRPFLRRPLSIADRWSAPDGAVHLCVISRTVGAGTRWLEGLRPGDTLNVTGPLGRGFRVPPHDVPLVLLGGGVGIPPLLYLARCLHKLGRRDVTAIVGARTRELLPLPLLGEPLIDGTPTLCAALPGGAAFETVITSDDASVGVAGIVSDGLRKWYEQRAPQRQPVAVFACGPEKMLKAAAQVTRELGLTCQLCIERNMACGLGSCLSCVVRVRDEHQPEGWRWALACADGPVFDRDDLLDYGAASGA